jgi:hypothetical protein
VLVVSKDGVPVDLVPVTSETFTHTFTATRDGASGPLGTFWRVDTLAPGDEDNGPYYTTIANPIFLAPPAPDPTSGGEPGAGPRPGADPASGGARLPATGGSLPVALAAAAALAALAVRRVATR